MIKDEIRLGSKVEIWVSQEKNRSQNRGTDAKYYASRVFNVNDDDTVDIDVPTEKGVPVFLSRELRYSFIFIHQGAMKIAEGFFIGRAKIENFPLYRVKLLTKPEKFQRRAFYRLPVQIPLEFTCVNIRQEQIESGEITENYEVDVDNLWHTAMINDVSGGGARFASEAPIMDLPYIYMKFFLESDNFQSDIGIFAKVLDRQPVPRSLNCMFRCKFIFEKSSMREKIIQFIYKEQRKIRRKQQGLF